MENIELVFRKIDVAYREQPEKGEVSGTIKGGWTKGKREGGFVLEAAGAQSVHDTVTLQAFEFGQVVAEVTDSIAAVEGALSYRIDLKLWKLQLELRSVPRPSNVPGPLEVMAGSTNASLRIHQTAMTTKIQENQFSYPSAQLVLRAETKVEDAGSESVREAVAVHATFASSELQPDPEFRPREDLAIDFGIDFPDSEALYHLRIVIPSALWADGDGGGFKIEDGNPQAAGIRVLVVQHGQVVTDRTDHVAASAATLRPDPTTKAWELKLEITGTVTPSDRYAPLFARAWGARLAMVEVGQGLEQVLARLAGAEAIF